MDIQFREIDKTNRRAVKKLKPARGQGLFIYSNAECLRQAWWQKTCTTEAVYDGSTLIGFAFYGSKNREKDGRVWLYSFMIDREHQGHGYGRAAFPLLLTRIVNAYPAEYIFLSVHPDNRAAIGIYEKEGFTFTGEKNVYQEKIMKYSTKERGQ